MIESFTNVMSTKLHDTEDCINLIFFLKIGSIFVVANIVYCFVFTMSYHFFIKCCGKH